MPAPSPAGAETPRTPWLALGLALAAAAALRLTGIGYGLPAVFNSDEPHLVNVAVSFGAGTLNPHLFKYPTLWMYVLFAAYGGFFLLWSGFGRLHSAADFGRYFAWHPTPFYLIGRLMAAGLSVAAIVPVYRAGRRWLGAAGAVTAALLLAVSPAAVEAAHSTKPESLMFFWSALAWALSAAYIEEGRRRDLVVAGIFAGLALSTQYTAGLLGTVLLSAWLARRLSAGQAEAADLVLAGIAAAGAFLAGSPFIALDFRTFWSTAQDIRRFEDAVGGPVGLWVVAKNVLCFAGPWLGGAAAAAGAVLLARRDRARAVWLVLPVLAYLLVLSRSPEGGWPRYLLPVFPGLALLAGCAVQEAEWALGGRAALVLAMALAAPGLLASAAFDRLVLLPDTRTLSAEWVEAGIPPGRTLLLDQEHASPRLALSRATVERLLEQTRATGHPRAKYYQYLLEGHSGGGWGVYRVLRDYKDLHSHPAHAAFSALGQPMLDVRAGLSVARAAGVDYVVLTAMGADPQRSPQLAGFLEQVRREGSLIASFQPDPGRIAGPKIEIYRIK